jgi:hypothetical protein
MVLLGFQSLLFFSTTIRDHRRRGNDFEKYLYRIGAFTFFLLVKVLNGPMLGLSVKVLYCNAKDPTRLFEQCYSPEHIVYCCLAAWLLLCNIYQPAIYGLFCYAKNPMIGSGVGMPNRNYALSKGVLKLLFPIYFVLNSTIHL